MTEALADSFQLRCMIYHTLTKIQKTAQFKLVEKGYPSLPHPLT